jgi:hypothetical protein
MLRSFVLEIPVPSRLRRVPGNEIGADYSGQRPNCNVALPLESGRIRPFPGPVSLLRRRLRHFRHLARFRRACSASIRRAAARYC